jgi:glutamyl-tRNA reductase
MTDAPFNLWTVGLSHRTAPVEVREKLALDSHALGDACRSLRQQPHVEECLVLSTCNRVEAVALLRDGIAGGDLLRGFWASLSHQGRSGEAYSAPRPEHFFALHGADSVRHLFRVAASLDSMVVGEPQILGQLKTAYATARDAGAVHGALDLVVTRSFQVAKRVRTETGIGESAVSVSFAAVELARRIFGDLRGKRVLIVGAGKMSELAARHLRQSGAEHIYVTNRTHHRAVELASVFHGQSLAYADLPKRLADMDIVITSSAAPHYVITQSLMRSVMEQRRNKPTFLIDIAVPRNIEPTVHQLDQVFLYDIDDLHKVVEENLRERASRADRAEEIVREEVTKMLVRLRAREVAPTIVRLQQQLERIRVAEVQRLRRKLAPISAEQEEAIDMLTRSIVAKIAHGPIAEIRRHATDPEGAAALDSLRRAFRIEDASDVETVVEAPPPAMAEPSQQQSATADESNASDLGESEQADAHDELDERVRR